MGSIHNSENERQQRPTFSHPPNNMKAATLASLFLLACLMVVSALADGPTAGSTDDDVQTLFRSISGGNGIMGEAQMAGIRQACNSNKGLKELEINIDIKLVLVKINNKWHSHY